MLITYVRFAARRLSIAIMLCHAANQVSDKTPVQLNRIGCEHDLFITDIYYGSVKILPVSLMTYALPLMSHGKCQVEFVSLSATNWYQSSIDRDASQHDPLHARSHNFLPLFTSGRSKNDHKIIKYTVVFLPSRAA